MSKILGFPFAVPIASIIHSAAWAPQALAQATTGGGNDCGYRLGPGMMWGSDYQGGFGMFFGFLFMLIVVLGVVAAVIAAVRYFGSAGFPAASGMPNRNGDAALSILKERFAKGEIDAKEYDERRQMLLK